jgi:hypothetical protein
VALSLAIEARRRRRHRSDSWGRIDLRCDHKRQRRAEEKLFNPEFTHYPLQTLHAHYAAERIAVRRISRDKSDYG